MTNARFAGPLYTNKPKFGQALTSQPISFGQVRMRQVNVTVYVADIKRGKPGLFNFGAVNIGRGLYATGKTARELRKLLREVYDAQCTFADACLPRGGRGEIASEQEIDCARTRLIEARWVLRKVRMTCRCSAQV